MKTFMLTLISLLSISCFSQKEDYIWLFGYGGWSGNPNFGDVFLDFSTSPPELLKDIRELNLDLTNASICDENGDLLLYSNGISISNGQHEIIENGEYLNYGHYVNNDQEDGYRVGQGAFFIQSPKSKSQFYLIHVGREIKTNPMGDSYVTGVALYYTLVDLGSGSERVIEKNVPIISDEISAGQLTAVKHANGRDWWILSQRNDSKLFYQILVSPSGIKTDSLKLDRNIDTGLGQAVFSPDGSKYITVNNFNGTIPSYADIFDFDRCTGELSNHEFFTYGDRSWDEGVAVSSNSRYLYIVNYTKLFQYDLWVNNVKSSEYLIEEWDSTFFPPPLSTRFHNAQLAPDGKIYINTNSTSLLHVIHEPDKRGDSCNFEQRSLNLGVYNKTLPNFPNYRLGALENSPCDTLTTTTAESITLNQKITLYPNPTNGELTIDFEKPTDGAGRFLLFDLTGKQVRKFPLAAGQSEFGFELSELARGIYFYKIEIDGVSAKAGKLVIGD